MKKQQVMIINSKKKHSVRYDAEDKNNAIITSVYVMNAAFEDRKVKNTLPASITITVEYDDE